MTTFLEVKNLEVSFRTDDGVVQASRNVSFSVAKGETLGIVGESGSGKSVSNLAVMGLHNPKQTVISGEILVHRESGTLDVVKASKEEIRKMRGKDIAMIFQDPMSALHPYYTIGDQIAEAWSLHNKGSKKEALNRAAEMLELVGIPSAGKRISEFPHQFSGGMRQRAMIAMALVNSPSLLIADEPTTALDVTVQAQILKLIKEMQAELDMAVIMITHDLGVIAEVADRVNVMYGGQVVEESTVDTTFYNPAHPYTLGLLSSIPRVDKLDSHRLSTIPGQPPSLISLPAGCAFAPRCSFAGSVPNNLCADRDPDLIQVGSSSSAEIHKARCHAVEAGISTGTGGLA